MTDVLTRLRASGDLPAAPSDLEAPPSALAGTVAERLVLAVAPSTGRFRPAETDGPQVEVGSVLGHVTGFGGRADAVIVPVRACLSALLARPGQLVYAGQALAWLERAGADGAAGQAEAAA